MSIHSIKVGNATHPIMLGNDSYHTAYDADGNLFITADKCSVNFGAGDMTLVVNEGGEVEWESYAGVAIKSTNSIVNLYGGYGVSISTSSSHTVTIDTGNLTLGKSSVSTAVTAYISGSTVYCSKYLMIGNANVMQNPSYAYSCLNIGYSNTLRCATSATNAVILLGTSNTIVGNNLNNRNGLLIAGNYCTVASPSSAVYGVAVYGYAASIQASSNVRQVYIGCGYSSSYTKNALSIAKPSSSSANPTVYLNASANTSGAGLAEMYEWVDGNPESESRYGRFVTTVGEKIRFATPEDNYVLGAVDPHPYIVGDCPTEEWHKRYLTDVFGNILEDEVLNEETGEIELVARENPEWDPDREYVTRDLRYEYSPITSKGKVVLIDDGTCVVDGFATVGEGGIATRSDDNVSVRVLKRIDDTHIRVYIDSAFLIRH